MASKYYTPEELIDTVLFIKNSTRIGVSNKNAQFVKTIDGEMFKYCFIKEKYKIYKNVELFARDFLIFTKTGY